MHLLRRRPILRAAAIGGGAYYAGKRRQDALVRKRVERAREAAAENLARLSKLHEQGVLSNAEFARQKARLLNAE